MNNYISPKLFIMWKGRLAGLSPEWIWWNHENSVVYLRFSFYLFFILSYIH